MAKGTMIRGLKAIYLILRIVLFVICFLGPIIYLLLGADIGLKEVSACIAYYAVIGVNVLVRRTERRAEDK